MMVPPTPSENLKKNQMKRFSVNARDTRDKGTKTKANLRMDS
jgi:hypothetical protein